MGSGMMTITMGGDNNGFDGRGLTNNKGEE